MTAEHAGAAPQVPAEKALSVRGATFLGIGSMIGAGIVAFRGRRLPERAADLHGDRRDRRRRGAARPVDAPLD